MIGIFKFPWGVRRVPMSGEKKAEMVDHPEHYGGKDNPYEVIKILENIMTEEEFIGFCKGNAFKYMARAKGKLGGMLENEDYKKSEWYFKYMNDFIKRKSIDEIRNP